MPAKNLTLTARWEVNQYTLTFDTDGGNEVLEYGKIPVHATPTKGYVFTGWYTADGVRVEGDLKLTNDLAIYAKFFAGDVDGND